MFCKKSNDIDMAPWKMAWILTDFDLSLLRIPYVKHTNCENSRSAAKEVSILLLSWSNLSIISSKWQISWILIDLYLSLLLNLRLKLIYCENSRCFERWEKVLVYIWQSSPSCIFARGKNVNSYGEELRKVLKFQKSHRKASVPEPLF